MLFSSFSGDRNNIIFSPSKSNTILTAILALPVKSQLSREIITGDHKGGITLWCGSDGHWVETRRIRNETIRKRRVKSAWVHYEAQSVVGLCALEDGRFFSVDASGEVLEWSRRRQDPQSWTILRQRSLPRPATLRCIAVHPASQAPWKSWGKSGRCWPLV